MDDSLGREQAVRLHQALERASIGHRRLWVRYLSLGGTADELEVGAYLHQCLELPVRERDLLTWAANTLLDRRYHPHVPSSADLLRQGTGRGTPERTA